MACGPEPLTAPRGTETPTARGRRGLEPQAPGACRTRPAPHGCCAAIVAPSSGWPPPFPRESWREGRSSRHAGGGFCGLREGSPPGWAPDPATIGPLAPPQAAWPDPGCGGDKGDIVPMSLSSASGLQHLPHPHPWVLRRTSPGAGAWSPPRLPPGSPGSVWHLFLWRSPPRCVGEPACLDPHGGPQRGARGLAGPACVSAAVSSS